MGGLSFFRDLLPRSTRPYPVFLCVPCARKISYRIISRQILILHQYHVNIFRT